MERIKLNLIPSGVAPIVHLSQYDDGRQFGIDLFEGESVYVLDGAETLTVNSRKPDGHVVTLTVTNTGTSSLDVDTVEQLTAVHGVSYAKLKIEKGAVTIATLPFLIDVSRDPLENGDPSESFIQNLETQIAEGVAEEVATQYDSSNVIFDNEPTDNHGIGYTVTSEGIKTAIDNAFDYDNTASGSLVHITDGADNIPVKSLASEIVAVESGSGEKSPDNPYTISGFDNAVVTVCSKNFYHGTLYNGQVGSAGGYGSTNTRITNVNGSEISKGALYLKSGSYILSISGLDHCTVLTKNNNNNIVDNFANSWHDLPYTFTLTKDAYLFFTARKSDNSNITPSDYSPMIRLSSIIDETYEQYNGNTYTFAFGQTVYGGHLNVTTGELTITHGYKTYNGSENWLRHPSDPTAWFYIAETDFKNQTTDILSNMFTYNTGRWNVNNSIWNIYNQIHIRPDSTVSPSGQTDAGLAEFKAYLALHPLEVCAELATPITLLIASQDIPTLLGENNIYSNCGDVEVNYYTSKSNDILEFVDSEIGKKNGTNIPIEENSQDSIKTYVDNGLGGKVDEGDCVPFELDYPSSITGLVKYANGCYYNPQTNEVHINIVIYSNNNNIPNNNGVIATIPSEYRPSAERVVASFSEILDENDALHFEAIQPIGTNGEIKLHNFVYSGLINTICMNFVYYK